MPAFARPDIVAAFARAQAGNAGAHARALLRGRLSPPRTASRATGVRLGARCRLLGAAADAGAIGRGAATRRARAAVTRQQSKSRATSDCTGEMEMDASHRSARSLAHARMAAIRVKRVREAPSGSDGARVLVDRLWPRGVSKEAMAPLHAWRKDVAPSNELRRCARTARAMRERAGGAMHAAQRCIACGDGCESSTPMRRCRVRARVLTRPRARSWYAHEPAKWPEFARRYAAELAAADARGGGDSSGGGRAKKTKKKTEEEAAGEEEEASGVAWLARLVRERGRAGEPVTLLFGAADAARNNAVVLKAFLEGGSAAVTRLLEGAAHAPEEVSTPRAAARPPKRRRRSGEEEEQHAAAASKA
jgi:uncharacterized protein YeaO (DUF488 family)